jgi:epoxyqueuosine reductase
VAAIGGGPTTPKELSYNLNVEDLAATVKERARELGFTNVGICRIQPPPHLRAYRDWIDKGFGGEMAYLREHLPLKADPRSLLEDARSVIAVTLNYNQEPISGCGAPKIARYALGRDYHKVMKSKLRTLKLWLGAQHPDATFRACVDSAPIMERDFAQLAGLGWFGKNTCLIDSRGGSWFFIGLLLTSLELEEDLPAIGGCGTCSRCVEACPTGAIVFEDDHWQVDARRCISYLTIEKRSELTMQETKAVGGWTFGCDICQEVCPFNEQRSTQPLRAADTEEADFKQIRQWPDLQQLAQVGYAEWDELTRGSAVRRAGYEGLRRNACANLENGN